MKVKTEVMKRLLRISIISVLSVFFLFQHSGVYAASTIELENKLNYRVSAEDILGPEWMQGEHHSVYPYAVIDRDMLDYQIRTNEGDITIRGTKEARVFIHELYALELLKTRSTPGVMLQSTGSRMVNIVKTPVRAVKEVGMRAGDVSSVKDAALFIPDLTIDVAGGLLNGAGELLATGQRLATGVGDTKCKGLNCVGKAGEDIWSGFNSLMGKHNAARKLHREFGTDPQTENKAFRRQVDRISYAESYVGTAIKIGVGNAGISTISPIMRGVGYYNNGEFVGSYEDAHKRRNYEKDKIESWGEDRARIEAFYKSKIFTKLQRRQFFTAMETLQDPQLIRRIFDEAYWADDRVAARAHVARAQYIAELAKQGNLSLAGVRDNTLSVKTHRGAFVTPIYANMLDSNKYLSGKDSIKVRPAAKNEIHILGRASQRFVDAAARAGFAVRQFPQ